MSEIVQITNAKVPTIRERAVNAFLKGCKNLVNRSIVPFQNLGLTQYVTDLRAILNSKGEVRKNIETMRNQGFSFVTTLSIIEKNLVIDRQVDNILPKLMELLKPFIERNHMSLLELKELLPQLKDLTDIDEEIKKALIILCEFIQVITEKELNELKQSQFED